MHWEAIEQDWQTYRDALHDRWRRLSDDDLDAVNGNRDGVIGCIQGRYGITRDQADAQLEEWQRDLEEPFYLR